MPDIDLPVIQTLAHPPIGFLRREIISGTFTGGGDLTRPSGPFNVDAWGLSWDFFSVPAPFGYDLGQPIVYHNRMIQLSANHAGTDGHVFISEFHSFFSEGIYWLWDNALPTNIHYEIAPGVVVVFFWLLV